jgi:hypothetical protein
MSSVSSPGIFHDLFTPLAEAQTAPRKDYLDHVADYADTTSGAWDVFRFIENPLSYVKFLPNIPVNYSLLLEKVRSVASSLGMGLCIPKILSDCNNLRRSFTNLLGTQDLPYSDPLRTRKVAQAAKKTFTDTVDLTNDVSLAALLIDNGKVFIFEASYLRIFDGVYNLTSVISDGVELITECFKLNHYHSPEMHPRNQAEAAKLGERKTLSWIVIAKDVASIGGAAIALVGIVFGIATQSLAIVSIVALVLGTVWLTTKLAAYFYNKIVVEAPASLPNRLIVNV